MDIHIMTGVGTGKTTLSAFDSALKDAGVLNYNLIALSSVIPPNSKVTRTQKYETPESEFGHRLYVVMAEIRSNEVGKYLAAGIGWYQFGSDNRGVFVEHEIIGETRVAVESEIKNRIKNSLKDLCDNRGIKYNEKKVKSAICITRITNQPTSALVLAVYQSQSWESVTSQVKEVGA